MTVRAVQMPRIRTACGVRCEQGSCVLDLTRVVESWDPVAKIWRSEIRLCHLHAIEYVTGKPVYLPTFAQKQLIMLELGA